MILIVINSLLRESLEVGELLTEVVCHQVAVQQDAQNSLSRTRIRDYLKSR